MISVAQIRPNGILCYPEFEKRFHGAKFYKRIGDVDEQKVRRFKKYSNLLLFLSTVKTNFVEPSKRFPEGITIKWRLNFLTVTVPSQPLQGDNLTKAVALFFQKLRNHGFKHYIWRKEKQKKTQNLHWHIMGCTWIHYQDLNKIWVDSLKRHCPGMMRKSLVKFKAYRADTDVRAVCSIRGAMRDLQKYWQKADLVDGNTFGVSHALAQIPYFSIESNFESVERCMNLGKKIEAEWSSFYVLPWWLMLRTLKEPIKSQVKAWQQKYTIA